MYYVITIVSPTFLSLQQINWWIKVWENETLSQEMEFVTAGQHQPCSLINQHVIRYQSAVVIIIDWFLKMSLTAKSSPYQLFGFVYMTVVPYTKPNKISIST